MPTASYPRLLHELYQSCRGELEAVLLTKVDCRDTAADLCQEAFIRLCRIEDLTRIGNLKAYLFRTAFNLVCDHYRSQAIRATNTVAWEDTAAIEPEDQRCAETVAHDEEQLENLLAALQELPPFCQRIFYLSRFEGLKQREIARQLGISVRTVEENVKRALRHCGKALAKA